MCKGTEAEGAGVHVTGEMDLATGWVMKLGSCVEYESCLVSQMGLKRWASFPVASPAPSLAYMKNACLCACNIPTKRRNKTPSLFKTSSSLAYSSSAPILLYVLHHSVPFSESSNSLNPLVSSFYHLNIPSASVLKMTVLALPPNWLQVTFTRSGSGLGVLCGYLNHPLHATLLHFCHILLLLSYLSLLFFNFFWNPWPQALIFFSFLCPQEIAQCMAYSKCLIDVE